MCVWHGQFSNLDSVLVQNAPRVAMYACDKKAEDGPMAHDNKKISHLLERRGTVYAIR
jgi:hypothetical protein